jgi:hypothetical protein
VDAQVHAGHLVSGLEELRQQTLGLWQQYQTVVKHPAYWWFWGAESTATGTVFAQFRLHVQIIYLGFETQRLQ